MRCCTLVHLFICFWEAFSRSGFSVRGQEQTDVCIVHVLCRTSGASGVHCLSAGLNLCQSAKLSVTSSEYYFKEFVHLLKHRVTKWELHPPVHSPKACCSIAIAGPGSCITRPRVLDPSLAVFPSPWAGSWILQSRAGAPVCNRDISSTSLTDCATVPNYLNP